MPKLVSIDSQSYAALTSQSLRATIGPLRDNCSLHYVIGISEILPYNRNVTLEHSSFFPPTHGSIMLPPRQPRVSARLARWQIVSYKCSSYLTKTASRSINCALTFIIKALYFIINLISIFIGSSLKEHGISFLKCIFCILSFEAFM